MGNSSATAKAAQEKFSARVRSAFPKAILLFAVMTVVILVIILRDTRYFFIPRFWAEEGKLHFAYSYSHTWLESLLQPQVGYLNFWPNLATKIATIPPLEWAPLVTTLLAFLIQLVPIVLILFSRSPFWKSLPRKLFGVAIFIFSPLTMETWLNTINSFTYFAIATFLILLEDAPAGRVRLWANRVMLLIGGLTGMLSCFLIPLYFFRAFHEKDKERWIQTLILAACVLVHIYLIFTYTSEASFKERFHMLGFSTLGVTMWTQGIGLFVFGFDQAREWAQTFFSLAAQDTASFQMWGRFLLIFGLVLLFLLPSNLPRKIHFLFISSYLILMVFPMMFSVIEDKYALSVTGLHQRLFLAPNTLLGWMLLLGAQFKKGNGLRLIFANLVSLLCALVVGASLFWGIQSYQKPWFVTAYWPDWKAEVSAWRANPEYLLNIQPEGWTVELKKPRLSAIVVKYILYTRLHSRKRSWLIHRQDRA